MGRFYFLKVFIYDSQLNPAYDIEEFFEACKKQSKTKKTKKYVFVAYDAMISGKVHFNFPTSLDIIRFFARRPKIFFQNTTIQKKNIARTKGEPIDGYTFNIGNNSAYFAIVCDPNIKLWRIKSLKPNENQMTRRP